MAQEVTYLKVFFFNIVVSAATFIAVMVVSGEQHIKSRNEGKPSCISKHYSFFKLMHCMFYSIVECNKMVL